MKIKVKKITPYDDYGLGKDCAVFAVFSKEDGERWALVKEYTDFEVPMFDDVFKKYEPNSEFTVFYDEEEARNFWDTLVNQGFKEHKED